VTDGFTGNVALKTLEGGMKALSNAVIAALGATEVADEAFAGLLPLYATVDPDTYGGAMLLGVKGVCIISHGSSSPTAIVNAVTVARDMVEVGLVDRLRAVVASD
jgi:glycerol-3-phosphate acyltransferase PlsX